MFSELSEMFRVLGRKKREALVDLNLLLQKVTGQLLAQYPGVEIESRDSDGPLPKVMTDPVRAEKIVRNLLSHEIRSGGSGQIRIGVGSQCDGGLCRIVISGGRAPLPAKQAGRLLEFFSPAAGDAHMRIPGDGSSLAVTRQLAYSLGWDIDLTHGPDECGQVMLSFPLGK
jgi:light-regulated signal transduction histidine kinase (bacteriophytochrome)